jgi:hypothetical protein
MHRLAAFGCLQFFALRARTLCVRQNCGFQAVAVAKLKAHPLLPGEIATASEENQKEEKELLSKLRLSFERSLSGRIFSYA